jgi:hypothetical protein
MTTVKTFLVVGSCGLMLWGAMAAQAMGLSSVRASGGPVCFTSSDGRGLPFSDTSAVRGDPCPPPKGEEEDIDED